MPNHVFSFNFYYFITVCILLYRSNLNENMLRSVPDFTGLADVLIM